MEKNQHPNNNGRKGQDDLNPNTAYSGSGDMQPGGPIDDADRLSEYPDGNQPETQKPDGKSVDEATDPNQLSNL